MADFTDSFYFTDEPDNNVSGETVNLIKGTAVPFKDQFPKDSLMYRDLTTKFSDLHRKSQRD